MRSASYYPGRRNLGIERLLSNPCAFRHREAHGMTSENSRPRPVDTTTSFLAALPGAAVQEPERMDRDREPATHAASCRRAIDRGQKVYVKDASVFAAIKPTAPGGYGAISQRQGELAPARDRQVVWRPPLNETTYEDVTNHQGRMFYQPKQGVIVLNPQRIPGWDRWISPERNVGRTR
jgi:hypothetical protein